MSNYRTPNFIATIPMKNEEQVIEVKKVLEQIFGWVVLKGRHSDRKSVVKGWRKWAQNDVPWRNAEYIDVYLHPKNPNYNSKVGIRRQNMRLTDMNVIIARRLGNIKLGLADGHYNTIQSKGSPVYQTIMGMYYRSKQKPKINPRSNQPHGSITNQIWNFMNSVGEATYSEMKTFYDVDIRGNATMIDGGSFIHHLQSLRKPSKKRGWYLSKQLNNKYALRISK